MNPTWGSWFGCHSEQNSIFTPLHSSFYLLFLEVLNIHVYLNGTLLFWYTSYQYIDILQLDIEAIEKTTVLYCLHCMRVSSITGNNNTIHLCSNLSIF